MASTKPTMPMRSVHQMLLLIMASFALLSCQAFVPASTRLSPASRSLFRPTHHFASGYVPPVPEEKLAVANKKTLYPKVGDFVRYFDLDGGKEDGEVLVGKISYIQKNIGKEGSGWTVDITGLEDVGDGYYADYPSRQRAKKATKDLASISPVTASFVRSENAFKIPREAGTGRPAVRAQQYDIDGYEGPFSDTMSINQSVVEQDAVIYEALKGKLLKYTAITGAAGALSVDLTKGTEDAVIYGAGAFASILYLLCLSLKTDTIASEKSKMGNNLSNLRFVIPFILLAGITLYNKSLGDANPVQGGGTFDTVTAEQFGAAIVGFLTYRIPLFLTQLQDALKDDSGRTVIPGSVGVAMQLVKDKDEAVKAEASIPTADSLATIFLVSGPQATGRTELVKRLIEEGEGRFIEPYKVDSVAESAKFERLQQREEFLTVSKNGRYGTTRGGIVAAAKECGPETVVVVDADVALAKQMSSLAGTRLVGVWVGLRSVKEFEARLEAQIDSGDIVIPEDETRESLCRARIREIVGEIEFGISSGIFEFTILNDDEEESMRQLRGAAAYCF
jgi:guanylate kinase